MILDFVTDSFSTGVGASTLDLADETNFVRAHPWLLFAGVGAVMLVCAAVGPGPHGPGVSPVYRLVTRIVMVAMGLVMLAFAVLTAMELVRM